MIDQDNIFFHEDDYCQIELLPEQNRLATLNEVDKIESDFTDRYTESGFIEIYSRDKIKFPLINLRINLRAFEDIIRKNSLGYFAKVYTGYSSEKIYKVNSHAFYFENYVLFYEYDNSIITKAWINYSLISDTLNIYPSKLEYILINIGNTFNLVLVDWNEITAINLQNILAIKNYIKNIL